MTLNEKELQATLLHRLCKENKSPKILEIVNKVIEWKRVSLDNKDIAAYIVFNLKMKEGFEELVIQKEVVTNKETHEQFMEECVYMIKLEKENAPTK